MQIRPLVFILNAVIGDVLRRSPESNLKRCCRWASEGRNVVMMRVNG
jgi:hypothetical protein